MNFKHTIIRFSLNHRFTVLLGTFLLIIGGVYSVKNMDIDVLPDLTAPTVVVMTDVAGMAPEEVEQLVTFPIETAVNGATNVRRVRSTSSAGVSFVWAEFDWGMDVFKARQIISEKMVALSESLPEGVTPVLAPQSSIMGEILFIGLQSDTTSLMELRTIADWVVKPAILSTGGVSQVTTIGGELKQYQILADPARMNVYGVTMADLEAAGRSLSTNSVGGVVRDWGNEYALRGMGRTCDLEALGGTFVKFTGEGPVMLEDVADIVIAPAFSTGNATINAKPAVILSVSKQPSINTLEVSQKIEDNLLDIAKSLPEDVHLNTRIFRQADFIESSVSNVGSSLLEGALFAIIILSIFLASFRTTFISVVAIPLSLLGTCVVLYVLGFEINTMTLGGMCIAIGSIVDDAIIDVENVYKRLRQNHLRPLGEREGVFNVVFEASKEIRASILNATLIVIVAFVPLFFLSGMEGRMLKPLGVAYIISLCMSLLVAMTLTPLLCRMMISDEKYLFRYVIVGFVVRHLSACDSKALSRVLEHKTAVLSSTIGLLLLAIGLFLTMGQGFLPDFNEGSAVIMAVTSPSASLEVSDELGYMMEAELLEIPEVTCTARRTG